MRPLNTLFKAIGQGAAPGGHLRQFRMIHYISCEFIIVCAIIIYLYTLASLWYLVALLGLGALITLVNLGWLIHSRNTKLCGHVLTSTALVIIIVANYLVRGGVASTYSVWFYVIPLLAASLIGGYSFLLYSALSLLMIIGFSVLPIRPYYQLPAHELFIIAWVNHLFAYLIIVTTLYSLMRENMRFEDELQDKNYLLQAEKDKYHHLARFDQLTCLPNRHFFELRLQEIIETLSANHCATIFFMDLDNLKQINDQFGHEAGDYLLLQTAIRLQRSFGQDDFIARLGGDEFTAIVLHREGQELPCQIAQRIVSEFNEVFIFKKTAYHSSISIGLATYPGDAKTVDSLMLSADLAMYAAKRTAGSSYHKAIPSLGSS